MKTTTMSRVLLTVFILVLIVFGLLWISGSWYIVGWICLIGGLAALVWTWLPVLRKTT